VIKSWNFEMQPTRSAIPYFPSKSLSVDRFQPAGSDAERSLANAEGLLSQAEAAFAEVELSVVMPCLNEADTVATCVSKAVITLANMGITSEVIVADNGSTDGSQELARSAGARVVQVNERGYGAALMGGIRAARGKYIVMGW
jgi:cellulose synthase/poly-beta-1,6-N-acetylglucosamine synthase-like glycosyltransferase